MTGAKVLSNFARCRSGGAAIEFAFVFLLLVMLVVGIIETGRALHVRNHLGYAADFAARKLLTDSTTSEAALDGIIRSAFTQGDAALLEIAFQNEAAGGAQSRRISVEYPLTLGFPGRTAIPLTLTIERRIPLT